MMLTPQQIAQYHEEGYTILPEFLSRAQIDAILAEIKEFTATATVAHHDSTQVEMEPNQRPDGKKVRRLYEPCTHYKGFRALSDSPEVLDVIEQLLGPNLYFHLSKVNMKPAKLGSVVDWHQDLTYYPLTNTDSVTVLFYLDDADRVQRLFAGYPRAHHRVMDHTLNGFSRGASPKKWTRRKRVYLRGKAGSMILMHCLTPHASAPNLSPHPRTTLIMAYRAADAFPIHLNVRTEAQEAHVRLVRGQEQRGALHPQVVPHAPLPPRHQIAL